MKLGNKPGKHAPGVRVVRGVELSREAQHRDRGLEAEAGRAELFHVKARRSRQLRQKLGGRRLRRVGNPGHDLLVARGVRPCHMALQAGELPELFECLLKCIKILLAHLPRLESRQHDQHGLVTPLEARPHLREGERVCEGESEIEREERETDTHTETQRERETESPHRIDRARVRPAVLSGQERLEGALHALQAVERQPQLFEISGFWVWGLGFLGLGFGFWGFDREGRRGVYRGFRGSGRLQDFGVGVEGVKFRGGLVFKAHRLLYHSTLGSRVTKKKKKE